MATTVSYSASMRTRVTTSSSNAKSSVACQGFYTSGTNYVGIVNFSGMALAGKVITGISLKVVAAQAGYGAGTTKTVYVRKSNYQSASQSGITGLAYCGDALGTFTGSFYGNTTTYTLSGTLLDNLAAYIAAGNNTICLYDPSPSAGSHGYSYSYMQWTECTITVTYVEAASKPSLSASSFDMGTAVTVYTNRQSTLATHTIRYVFGSSGGTIATDVADSCTWTPPVSLAAQIPNAASGWGALYCDTYVNGSLVATHTCTFVLKVPDSVVPVISSVSVSEAAIPSLNNLFGGYVRTQSKVKVSIVANGSQGSTVSSYRTLLDGTTYASASFVSYTLNSAGSRTMTITVTDSRGRTATHTETIAVLDYSPPVLNGFHAERCSADGSAQQVDGEHVRITASASVSSLNGNNSMICAVYYKTTGAEAWVQAQTLTPDENKTLSVTDLLLDAQFDPLSSYHVKLRIADSVQSVEQTVSIGTKQVVMDFYRDGTGIAFGKIAENAGKVEFGWPLLLSSALGVDQGGTGATTAAQACANLGAVKKSGDTMTGNLNISGYLYPSLYLLPTYNSTTFRAVIEGAYIGSAAVSAWEDSTGNDRRMLEIRTKACQDDLNWAVTLRTCENGSWATHRLFHDGMETPVPVGNGGTGAYTAAAALTNLGIFYSASLPSSGTDGQICLVPI